MDSMMLRPRAVGLGVLATAARLVAKIIPAGHRTGQSENEPFGTHHQRALPVLTANELICWSRTAGVIEAIKAKTGFSKKHFTRSVLPLIKYYAELVQQLLAAGDRQCAPACPLLLQALRRVDVALAFRRGQYLPRGAAPEDIMRLEHRWTYAVFIAALLYDIDTVLVEIKITIYGPRINPPKAWIPSLGSMRECGATHYSFDVAFRRENDESTEDGFALSLFQRWLPGVAQQWLSSDHDLMTELAATLSGRPDSCSDAIQHIVSRAAAHSKAYSTKRKHAGPGVFDRMNSPNDPHRSPSCGSRDRTPQDANAQSMLSALGSASQDKTEAVPIVAEYLDDVDVCTVSQVKDRKPHHRT
jgi:hypothetical protein